MKPTLATHTLVKNGQPFIGPVLAQVAPFADQMIVTVSEKSTDGTMDVIKKLQKEYPQIEIYTENVGIHRELTVERQKQIEKTTTDWALFLDDDDWWPESQLALMKELFSDDMDGYASLPFQLTDWRHHDYSWRYRWFTKWFRIQPGLHYRKPWPKDILYLGDQWLFWKKTNRVTRKKPYFIHLQNLKDWSFRNQKKMKYYKTEIGRGLVLPDSVQQDVDRIYEQIRN